MATSRARPLHDMEASVVAEVSTLVTRITGVQLGERQRVMVETRLKRRMAELGITDDHDYLQYLRSNLAEETEALVSLLTTHHTFFFREYQHFEYLENGALQALVNAVRARRESTLRVWSAACSRGQEVYSLAMFLADQLPRIAPDINFEIFGSDVDRESVAIAQNGVYHQREIKQVPAHYLSNHWAKGTGSISEYVKVKKQLKEHCTFKPANLLDPTSFKGFGTFDLIFCRNVFIYFTPEQITKITHNLTDCLKPEGSLIIGLSESLNGLSLPLSTVGPSVYVHAKAQATKLAAVPGPLSTPTATPATPAATVANVRVAQTAPTYRVVCVDDSPSVLAVMKQVLTEKQGFKIVGTAVNGIEAAAKITELKPDLVTLDIHMPQMTGLEYLQRYWTKSHPPVVIVSSVSREDAGLAVQCLRSGAVDYVEKPTLTALADRADEIRMKLLSAGRRRQLAQTSVRAPSLEFDQTRATNFATALKPTAARLLLGGIGDTSAIAVMLREVKESTSSIFILTEGMNEMVETMAADLKTLSGKNVQQLKVGEKPTTGIWIGDLKQHWSLFSDGRKPSQTSAFIFGDLTATRQNLLSKWLGAQVHLEDLPRPANQTLPSWVGDISPATSYIYMSQLYLSKQP